MKPEKITLGRELIIDSDSEVFINQSGFSVEYFDDTIELVIGIGKDYTASLIMTTEAWEEFKNGAIVNTK